MSGTRRWAFCRVDRIESEGDLYLWRLRVVQTPWGAIYLHRFARPDRDRHLHDHPWAFVSVVLRGGYTEQWRKIVGYPGSGWVNVTQRRRGSIHKVGLDICHRIDSIRPGTTTLVFCGPRSRMWGFYTENGWLPFGEYLATEGAGGTND